MQHRRRFDQTSEARRRRARANRSRAGPASPRDGRATRGAIVLALLLGLAGCAAGPNALWRSERAKPTVEVAPTQTLAVPIETARERAAAWLGARGFGVQATTAGLRGERATGADPAWSICPNPMISSYDDDSNQSRPAQLQERQATVALELMPDGDGARATLSADARAVMLDTFRSRTFTTTCRSTGVLERDLFAAMRAG